MNTVAQIIGLCALILSVVSFQQKTHKYILFFQLLSTAVWCIHFYMLGAYTGAMLNLIALLRSVVFINKGNRWADNIVWLVVFCIISVAACAITWVGPASILPMLGMICTTVAFWIKTPKYVRFTAFPSSPLWLVYNVINKSYAGAITETMNMISIIVAVIRLDLNKNTKTNKETRIK